MKHGPALIPTATRTGTIEAGRRAEVPCRMHARTTVATHTRLHEDLPGKTGRTRFLLDQVRHTQTDHLIFLPRRSITDFLRDHQHQPSVVIALIASIVVIAVVRTSTLISLATLPLDVTNLHHQAVDHLAKAPFGIEIVPIAQTVRQRETVIAIEIIPAQTAVAPGAEVQTVKDERDCRTESAIFTTGDDSLSPSCKFLATPTHTHMQQMALIAFLFTTSFQRGVYYFTAPSGTSGA